MARSKRPSPILEKLNAQVGDGASQAARLAESAELAFDRMNDAVLIPRERLRPMPNQPRQAVHDDESLRELARSIAAAGILEPVLACRDHDRPGYYVLIAGHRRLAAAELVARGDLDLPVPDEELLDAGALRQAKVAHQAEAKKRVATIPTIVRDVDLVSAFALSLVENLQRADLSRREVMDAVKRLKDEFHWSIREIARRTGRDSKDLSRLMRIAEDPELAPLVADEMISPTAAGLLVEPHNRAVRGPVLAAIRAGNLRTTGDLERALAVERARRTTGTSSVPAAPPAEQSDNYGQVRHMPHLTITDRAQDAGTAAETMTSAEAVRPPNTTSTSSVEEPSGTPMVRVGEHMRRAPGATVATPYQPDNATVERVARDVLQFLQREPELDHGQAETLRAMALEVISYVERVTARTPPRATPPRSRGRKG